MQTQATLLARVPDGHGKFPFIKVTLKKGQPVPIPGATAYYVRYRENGKRKTVAVGDDLTSAFLAFANRQVVIQQQGLGILPTVQKQRIPIADAEKRFIEDVDKLGKAWKTVKAYGKAIASFRATCKKTYLDEINRSDIIDFLGHLRSHLGKHRINGSLDGERNSTLINRLRYLRAFLLKYDVWRQGNPAKPLLAEHDWPKATRKNPDRYQLAGHIDKLLAVSTEDEKDLIHFLLCTGFRDEEVCHAVYQDIKRGKINVYDKPEYGFKIKDHEQRSVDIPLPGWFVKRMKARKERYPKNELIFTNSDGSPDKHLLNAIKKIAARAKLDTNATLHKFRRTFGTLMAKKFGVRQAQAMLGHSKIETTMAYLAADDMDNAEARQGIEEIFAPVGD